MANVDELPCPHLRSSWKTCPRCLEIENFHVVYSPTILFYGDCKHTNSYANCRDEECKKFCEAALKNT